LLLRLRSDDKVAVVAVNDDDDDDDEEEERANEKEGKECIRRDRRDRTASLIELGPEVAKSDRK
jgi:hypothetical protein